METSGSFAFHRYGIPEQDVITKTLPTTPNTGHTLLSEHISEEDE